MTGVRACLLLALAAVTSSQTPVSMSDTAGFKFVGSQGGGQSSGEYFGHATVISPDGLTAAVSSIRADVAGNSGAGKLTVLTRTAVNTAWTLKQLALTSTPGPYSYDGLGTSLAMGGNGTILVAGMPSVSGYNRPGRAAVFRLQGGLWSHVQFLTDAGMTPNCLAGNAVAMSNDGRLIAVGARNWGGGQGRVFMFSSASGTSMWSSAGSVNASISTAELFGSSLSMSSDGGATIIGAPAAPGGGFVYFLTGSLSSWTIVQRSVTGASSLGQCVAMSADGSTALAAQGNGGNFVRVFKASSGWSLVASIPAASPRVAFGYFLSLSGDGLYAIVGDSQNGPSMTGSAYIYADTAGAWSRAYTLSAVDLTTYSSFGSGVSLVCTKSGSTSYLTVAVGAYMTPNANYVGATYLTDISLPSAAPSASVTATGSVSPSRSGTASVTASPSRSASRTVSVTSSGSASRSSSMSLPASPSRSRTVTTTASLTASSSVTVTGSCTRTTSSTSSASGSVTTSFTSSRTSTVTASASQSGASSSSATSSQSGTMSATVTWSAVASATNSASVTISSTSLASGSSTASASASGSATASLSTAISVSAFATASSTLTSSPTSARSTTCTPSLSAEVTASVSLSATRSAMQSLSPSISGTSVASFSPPLGSASGGSVSTSFTSTANVASSTLVLASSSVIRSSTIPAASFTPPSAVTSLPSFPLAADSASPSAVATPVGSIAPSNSVAASSAAAATSAAPSSSTPTTETAAGSSGPVASASSLAATSASSSPAISTSNAASASPLPGSVSLSFNLPASTLATGAVIVSDSSFPVRLRVDTAGCIGACSVTCALGSNSSFIQAYSRVLVDASEAASREVVVWARFAMDLPPLSTLLACSVRSRDGAISTATVLIQRESTTWPLLSDVLLHLANGLVRSAAYGVTERISTVTPESTSGVVRAARQASVLDTFTITTVAGANVTLVARGRFAAPIIITLGGLPCRIHWMSSDASLLHIQLPDVDVLCASVAAREECGYQQLALSSGSVQVSCPPFCPGDVPGTIPAVFLDSASGRMLVVPSWDDGVSPPRAAPLSALPASGIYITRACTAAGWEDPSTGVCMNSSDPRSRNCAFGSGAQCVRCPVGAACPGGRRAWPLPGYYTVTEASGAVIECAPPAQRCMGWNATTASSACGPAYGSVACIACSHMYYAALDGSCLRCPVTADGAVSSMIIPSLTFIAGLLAALLTVYGCMLALAWVTKSRTDDAGRRMLSLTAWSFAVVQLLAQAGRAAAAGIPASLAALYAYLNVAQFQGIALPAACTAGYVFLNEVLTFAAAFTLLFGCMATSLVLFLHRMYKPAVCQPTPWVGLALRACVTGLTLVYPALINAALSIVICTPTDVTVRMYLSLDSDGRALASAGLQADSRPSVTFSVPLQASNPSHVCYEGHHRPVAIAAWFALILVGIAYPLVAVMLVHVRSRALLNTHALAPPIKEAAASAGIDADLRIVTDASLAPFVRGDFRASMHWFYAVDRLVLLCVAVATLGVPRPTTPSAVALRVGPSMAALAVNLVLVLLAQPYPHHDWYKQWIKVLSLVLALLVMLANAVMMSDASSNSTGALSYLIVALSALLLLALPLTFVLNALHPPPREPRLAVETDIQHWQVDAQPPELMFVGSVNPMASMRKLPALADVRGAGAARSAIRTVLSTQQRGSDASTPAASDCKVAAFITDAHATQRGQVAGSADGSRRGLLTTGVVTESDKGSSAAAVLRARGDVGRRSFIAVGTLRPTQPRRLQSAAADLAAMMQKL